MPAISRGKLRDSGFACVTHPGRPKHKATMSKPGPISAKPLSVLLSDVFSDAYAKQGFAARELVTRWAEIAGPEIAAACRAPENPVAAAGGGTAAGTGHAGAAGGGPDGAGNPARVRRHPAARQPLLRLERGRTAGAAPGAAVAPEAAKGSRRAGRQAVAEVEKTLSAVEDEELRAALARLGASIKRN